MVLNILYTDKKKSNEVKVGIFTHRAAERRALSRLLSIRDNPTHPLHNIISSRGAALVTLRD